MHLTPRTSDPSFFATSMPTASASLASLTTLVDSAAVFATLNAAMAGLASAKMILDCRGGHIRSVCMKGGAHRCNKRVCAPQPRMSLSLARIRYHIMLQFILPSLKPQLQSPIGQNVQFMRWPWTPSSQDDPLCIVQVHAHMSSV